MSADIATIVYSYFFVTAAILAGVGIIAKHSIQKHTEELKRSEEHTSELQSH